MLEKIKNFSLRRILAIFSVLAVMIVSIFLLRSNLLIAENKNYSSSLVVVSSTPSDYKYMHREWGNRIEKTGAPEAYKEFKRVLFSEDFNRRHLLSHLFGEILYEKTGLGGISICDNELGDFGCYHGFVLTAISLRGISAADDLNKFCSSKHKEKYLRPECQHGLGHGILEYLGRDKLTDALNVCANFSGDHIGCLMGVFMEYNVTTNIKPDDVVNLTRKLKPEDPYAPCNAVRDDFREACWRVLPQWWDVVLEKDYRKMGLLCEQVDGNEGRNACFRGIGNVAAHSSNFNPEETIKKCQAMPKSTEKIFCRSVTFQEFYSLPEYRKLAPILCQGLEKDKQGACITLTKLPE